MTTIWKFPLSNATTALEIPAGANVLRVDVQNGSVFLWAMVDTDAPKETRFFLFYGTGHEIKDADKLKFLNTFFVNGGAYVFHAFEILE